jgi:predicted RNA binding protein YcfA (HicA-like mRNA interferase family)
MKTKELIKLLEANGWILAKRRGKGSHGIYQKGNQSISVPKDKTDVPAGTLNAILKLAGLK